MNNMTEEQQLREKKTLLAIRSLRARLEQTEADRREPIAIVGMGCRFPGGIHSPSQLWELLHSGRDPICDVPSDRWDKDRFYDANPDEPGKMNVLCGGFVESVFDFDATFFSIAPREACSMDPQQRLLLEVSWEALEHAGIAADALAGSNTGVFIGICSSDHLRLVAAASEIDAYMATGNMPSVPAGRLSYFFGFVGPAMCVDTACSSSLVSLHQACAALRNRECDQALTGGVNMLLLPDVNICLSQSHMLAPDGRCKTFDAAANGYVRSEGCGIVVVKRLSDALKHGDRILALVEGSAVNQDGRTNGLTAPNGTSQVKVIQAALTSAQRTPADISYLEAHGTGTTLGDSIEVSALGRLFSKHKSKQQPLVLGSVKSNLGHLEAAAGIAGLMKVVLSFDHELVPGNLHLKQLNPNMDWDNLPIEVVRENRPWPRTETPRYAGISSFGFSGTNAHVILKEPPLPTAAPPTPITPVILPISAMSVVALRQLWSRHTEALARLPADQLHAYCQTVADGRASLEYRCFFTAKDRDHLKDQLQQNLDNPDGVHPHQGRVQAFEAPRLVYLFSGQGSQYTGMGKGLYETQAVFRAALDQCNAILAPLLGISLPQLLFEDNQRYSLENTAYTQPALFSFEYALAQWWLSVGPQPDAVMGHSVGEYVAAVISGVFLLEDGLKLITERARLMSTLPAGGAMVAVSASADDLNPYLQLHGGRVTVSAFNGYDNTVLSGPEEAIQNLVVQLLDKGVRCTRLKVSHAFHSPLMRPILDAFRQVASQVNYHPPKLRFISNLTGKQAVDEVTQSQYWVRHIIEPVHFQQGARYLLDQGFKHFLEVGPKPVLLGMLPPQEQIKRLPSLRGNQAEDKEILESLGKLWLEGFAVRWPRPGGRQVLDVPTYPFQRKTYQVTTDERDPRRPQTLGVFAPDAHPMLGRRHSSAVHLSETFYDNIISAKYPFFLEDHRIFKEVVVPGAAYLEMAIAAARDFFKTDAVYLEDMTFPSALVLPEHSVRKLQTVLSNAAEGRAQVGIYSQDQADPDSAWVHHAAGFICRGGPKAEAEHLFLEARQKDADHELPGKELYGRLWSRGYLLGPAFQAVQRTWVGDNTGLAEIKAPQSLHGGLTHFGLHPVLLDACLQSTMAVFKETEENFLPFSIERMYFLAPLCQHFYVLARARPGMAGGEHVRAADLDVFDPSGKALARIEGFVVKRATFEQLQAKHDAPWTQWLYETIWRDMALTSQARTGGQDSTWLLLAPCSETGSQLADQAKALNRTCYLAKPGQGYAALPNGVFHYNPALPADYGRLLKETGLPTHVALLLDSSGCDGAINPAATVATNCHQAQYLIAALIEEYGAKAPQLYVVTRGAVAATEGDTLSGLAYAPLWALNRCVALEQPDLGCRLIDLAPIPHDEELATLMAELDADDEEDHVALRGGRRLVARLVPGKSAAAPKTQPVKGDGVYLITGGLGNLGQCVAKTLVEQGARHLVLTSRTGAVEGNQTFLETIRQQEVTVTVCKADVAHELQMRGVFDQIKAMDLPLRGMIHTAGVLDDGLIHQLEPGRFDRVLAPKVAGTWHLHQLSRDQPLDFFVLFSSIASLLGSPAQSNYAAANGFMDGFAHWRRAQGLPALSINWGTWAGIGMAAEHNVLEIWSRKGVEALDAANACAALGNLLCQEKAQMGVAHMVFTRYLRSRKAIPLFDECKPQVGTEKTAQPNLRQMLEDAPAHRRLELLQENVLSLIASVLGLESCEVIDLKKGFFDMGMDSLTSLELRNRLQNLFQISLPSTLAFTYGKTIDLINFLASELISHGDPNVSAPPQAVEDKTKLDTDTLSEDDIATMLAQELEDDEADDYL